MEEASLTKFCLTYPTTNVGMQKWKLGRNVYTLRTRFLHAFAPTCVLSRKLSNKISAAELSRKLIKSALLVGWYLYLLLVLLPADVRHLHPDGGLQRAAPVRGVVVLGEGKKGVEDSHEKLMFHHTIKKYSLAT